MINTDWRGRAKPGSWYGQYYRDWEGMPAIPVPGYAASWCLVASTAATSGAARRWSGTPNGSAAMGQMPKGAHYIPPGRNTTPLTTKHNPTDTGVMRFQFEKGR